MFPSRAFAGAAALACSLAFIASTATAKPADYRFEVIGKATASGGKDTVRIRLVHLPDGKALTDAVIFEAKADMGPAGMQAMTAPVKSLPGKDGIYVFEVEPGMTGTWALHLAAKVQGEADTVRGTVNADLVK
jgi:hypothetical protein